MVEQKTPLVEIENVEVDLTMVEGKVVFRR